MFPFYLHRKIKPARVKESRDIREITETRETIKHIITKYDIPNEFEWKRYVISNPDLIKNGIITQEDAIKHWNEYGQRENRNIADYGNFNWRHYIIANPELIEQNKITQEDAYEHWITLGYHEKLPLYKNDFDWKIYAEINTDLRDHNIIEENRILDHWIRHGYNEGRAYKIDNFDWLFYIAFNCLYNGHITTETQAVLHWLRNGKHNTISHTTLNTCYQYMKEYDYSCMNMNVASQFNGLKTYDVLCNQSTANSIGLDQCYLYTIQTRNTPMFRNLEKIDIDQLNKYKAFLFIVDFPCFGGGCTMFLSSIISHYKEYVDFLIVRTFNNKIHWYINDEQILIHPTGIDDACELLKTLKSKIKKIFVNSIIGHSKQLLDAVFAMKKHISTITHDFKLLFDDPHPYYYELDNLVPNRLIDPHKFNTVYTQNIGNLYTFGKYLNKNQEIVICPLPDFKYRKERISTQNDKTVIGVLGDISDVKGCILVYHVIKMIRSMSDQFELIVFGNINVPYVTKYPYKSVEHLNELLVKHKPNLWLETSLWPETYSYTLTLMMITRLPILYQNKFYPCAVQTRLSKYPSAFSYNSIEDVDIKWLNTLRKNHFFTIKPVIIYPDCWSDYFSNYNNTQKLIAYNDQKSAKNVVIITSKIYTTQLPFSYSSTRSIYTPEQRFSQTLDTIESIRSNIPDVIIVLFDNSTFTEEQYVLLDKSVDHFLNITNNPIVNEYTNNSAHKIYGEIVQTYELLLYLERSLSHRIHIQNVFKISGRYVINNQFCYNKYDNDDIILKQNVAVTDRKYYFTCFYKFSYKRFSQIFDAIQKVYNGMSNSLHANKDWEVLFPQLLEYDMHEIETLGITQNIAVWNDKSQI